VAVAQADPELAHRDHLLLRIREVLVEVAAHYVHIIGQGFKIVVRLFGTDVSGGQDVVDAARHQQLLELGRQAATPMGNVQVAEYQNEHRVLCGALFYFPIKKICKTPSKYDDR